MASVPGPATEIGVVMLDQRVACGVGNVYKTEVLYACGVDPFTPVGALDAADRRRLVATASRLLRANLGAGPRHDGAGGLAVYGRGGPALPPLRHADPAPPAGRAGPHDLLVPDVPAVDRGANVR